MKHIIPSLLSILLMQSTTNTTPHDDFIITIEPTWDNLAHDNTSSDEFGGKWILAGRITFKKKKAKEPVCLSQLRLHWCGNSIQTLNASLYKKKFNPKKREFLPIDEYLVCDGIWNAKRQEIILPFDHKQTLGPIEVFYLVLTVPKTVELLLRNGYFALEREYLPEPFKAHTQDNLLVLALNTHH